MANHVYFNIQVENLPHGCSAFSKALKTEVVKYKNYNDEEVERLDLKELHEQPWMPQDYEKDEDGYPENSWDYYVNEAGAKWVNIEDWDADGGNYITGYSAWSHPVAMVSHLVRYLTEQTDTIIYAKMTYEDEFRNFIGVDTFEGFRHENEETNEVEYGVYHSEEYVDGDEITSKVEAHFDCDVSDEDFSWWDIRKNKDGVEEEPQTWVDDLVYDFFEKGYWEYD